MRDVRPTPQARKDANQNNLFRTTSAQPVKGIFSPYADNNQGEATPYAPQQRLNFLPDPQGQRAFRGTAAFATTTGTSFLFSREAGRPRPAFATSRRSSSDTKAENVWPRSAANATPSAWTCSSIERLIRFCIPKAYTLFTHAQARFA